MSYIKVSWPDSQRYNELSEEELEEFGIELGSDASYMVPEDVIDEVEAYLNGETEEDDEDRYLELYSDELGDDGWLSKEEYLECSGLDDPEEIEDDAYYDWVNECQRTYLEDLRAALLEHLPNNPVVIFGNIGAWDGTHEIVPEIITDDPKESNVWAAILKCANVSGQSSTTIKLDTQTGDLIVEVSHHDGTNSFTVRKVAEESFDLVNTLKDWGEDEENKYENIKYAEFTPDEFEL